MSRHHLTLNRRRWAIVRRAALDRYGWRCCQCGRAGRLEVDHVRPLEAGGAAYDSDNLQALCRSCHIRKTAAENRVRRPPRPEVEAWYRLVAELRGQDKAT